MNVSDVAEQVDLVAAAELFKQGESACRHVDHAFKTIEDLLVCNTCGQLLVHDLQKLFPLDYANVHLMQHVDKRIVDFGNALEVAGPLHEFRWNGQAQLGEVDQCVA